MSDQDQPQAPEHEQTRETRETRDSATRQQQQQGERGGTEQQQQRGGRHAGNRRRHGRSSSSPQQQQQGQQSRPESSLNMDELRELTELFTTHSLTDFEFENADIRVRLSRNPAPQAGAAGGGTGAAPAPATPAPSPRPATAAAQVESAQTSGGEETTVEDLHIITSPIVGTFYRASSPNAEPFVKAGSPVEQDTVVCIIEAMKLMNEIQAETSGIIEKVYVENGQPVEYGQPLFGIKK